MRRALPATTAFILLGVASCSTPNTGVPDAGPADAQTSDGGVVTEAGVCGPNPTTFTPGPMTPPETLGGGVAPCSPTQIQDYAACQTDTQSVCGEFLQQPGKTCAQCIETQSTASSWGPLVFTGPQQARYNSGGCVDLVLNQVALEPSSCGKLVFDSYSCQEAACTGCEGLQQTGGGDAFTACTALSIASGAPCASYDALVQDPSGPCNASTQPDAGDVSVCFPDPSQTDPLKRQKAFLTNIITVFCGS